MFLDRLFFATFVLLLISTMGIAIYQHELAHVFFNDKFGIESEFFLDLPFFVGVRSYGVQPEALKIMHGMNEAVSYNLTPYLAGILSIIGMGFWYIGNKIDYWFEKFEKKGITIEAIPPKPREEVILDEVKII